MGEVEGWTTRLYRRLMFPLLQSTWKRAAFLAGVAILFSASVALLVTKTVRVKMLPFDNKSEMQVIVDMPEGTPMVKILPNLWPLSLLLTQIRTRISAQTTRSITDAPTPRTTATTALKSALSVTMKLKTRPLKS